MAEPLKLNLFFQKSLNKRVIINKKMKKESKIGLMKKGWSKEEIKKAEGIIAARKSQDKSRSTIHFDRVLFWSVLFVMVIGNFLVAFVLIPLMLVMTKLAMSFFVIVIGLAVGLLFNFLVWDIGEHLTKKHHLLAATIIPILAVINLYAIVKISNSINAVFGITAVREDPLLISALYIIAFLAPYLFTLFYKKKIKSY